MDPQIMEKLCQYHMELWNWLAETGCEHKNLWPGWKCPQVHELCDRFQLITTNRCFACYQIDCERCFINWDLKHYDDNNWTTRCMQRGTFYRKWRAARSIKARKKYALIIADAFHPQYATIKPKNHRITKCQRIVNYLNQQEIKGFFLDDAKLVEQVVRFAQDYIDSVCYGTPLAEDIRQLIATTSNKQLRRHCGRACKIIKGE